MRQPHLPGERTKGQKDDVTCLRSKVKSSGAAGILTQQADYKPLLTTCHSTVPPTRLAFHPVDAVRALFIGTGTECFSFPPSASVHPPPFFSLPHLPWYPPPAPAPAPHYYMWERTNEYSSRPPQWGFVSQPVRTNYNSELAADTKPALQKS